jgi:hypothetical protein
MDRGLEMKWIVGLLALHVCVVSAAEPPLMKKFGDDFNPYTETPDFIEACRLADAIGKQKLTEDQESAALTCLGVIAGVTGVFDGAPRFTLDDGQSQVHICPQGKATYQAILAKALELNGSGEVDAKQLTPAQLTLAAVMRVQSCPA